MIKPLKAAFGLLTKVVNIRTKDNFIVSTIQNPSGVYETAVFKVPNLFILSLIARFIKPAFIVNSGNCEDAALKHTQVCQLFEQLDSNELIRKYKENGAIDNTKLFSREDHAIRDDKSYSADARTYYSRGNTYFDNKNYDQAISYYTQAINIDPHHADAYFNRGLIHKIKNNYDQAISDFTQAISIDPCHSYVYSSRGAVYWEKGNYDQAISDFTQAINIDPRISIDYCYRADSYYRQNNYDKAWEDVRKAQQMGFAIPTEFLNKLKKDSGRNG